MHLYMLIINKPSVKKEQPRITIMQSCSEQHFAAPAAGYRGNKTKSAATG